MIEVYSKCIVRSRLKWYIGFKIRFSEETGFYDVENFFLFMLFRDVPESRV